MALTTFDRAHAPATRPTNPLRSGRIPAIPESLRSLAAFRSGMAPRSGMTPPSAPSPELIVVRERAPGSDAGAGDRAPDGRLTLPFELRRKSRLRTRLDDGREVALMLERGSVLRGGDRLRSDCGRCIEVAAGHEAVSVVRAGDARVLARAAYHLGNRHVPVQVGRHELRYLTDHVLDEMVAGLGAEVVRAELPFEPEAGAYGHHGHHRHHANDGPDGHDGDHTKDDPDRHHVGDGPDCHRGHHANDGPDGHDGDYTKDDPDRHHNHHASGDPNRHHGHHANHGPNHHHGRHDSDERILPDAGGGASCHPRFSEGPDDSTGRRRR